jgi:hypothetical protein
LRAEAAADITDPRHLNPPRRSRSYPHMVKRARHNSYRVKGPGDVGIHHAKPPTVELINLKPPIHQDRHATARPTKLQLTA